MSSSCRRMFPGPWSLSGRSLPDLRCLVPLMWTLLLLLSAAVVGQEEPDTAAAAAGKAVFRAYCASCHGVDGRGGGDVAQYLRVPPTDLTRLQAENGGRFPFDEVVEITDGRNAVSSHGTREMPVWGGALKRSEGGQTEEEAQGKIRQLAHYLWSLQR